MLDEFIATNRTEIIERCKAKVASRSPLSTGIARPEHGVPRFLDELVGELKNGLSANQAIHRSATQHGHDLLTQGYTVSQVVHDYGDVCQAVTELAVEREAAISSDDFRTLNRCLDDAIAGAVTEYGRARDLSSERDAISGVARRGTLARDLLKTLQIAKMALSAIKSGKVGVGGSTGTVLALGLDTANDLAERLLVAEPAERAESRSKS